jgi:hypothetical protein
MLTLLSWAMLLLAGNWERPLYARCPTQALARLVYAAGIAKGRVLARPLRLGMTFEQVEAVLGPPDEPCWDWPFWEYRYRYFGLHLEFAHAEEGGGPEAGATPPPQGPRGPGPGEPGPGYEGGPSQDYHLHAVYAVSFPWATTWETLLEAPAVGWESAAPPPASPRR